MIQALGGVSFRLPQTPCADGRSNGNDQQQQQGQSREPRHQRVALGPTHQLLDSSEWTRVDRFMANESLQIIGQRLGRFVAASGILFQALQANAFHVLVDFGF